LRLHALKLPLVSRGGPRLPLSVLRSTKAAKTPP
jgi:hypothetical protein